MNSAAAEHQELPSDVFCDRVAKTNSTSEGFAAIVSVFTELNVTIERIILVRDDETLNLALNENASGVRRDIKGQIANTTLTVTCINPISTLQTVLQSIVIAAANAARSWSTRAADSDHQLDGARMVGQSAEMHALLKDIAAAAGSQHSVLIKGETGTGKTTAALLIHEQSRRANDPFVEINCAALPDDLIESELFGYEKGAFTGATITKKGLFEEADGGTLFLDEIAELKIELQAKLLTAIEHKRIRRLGSTKDVQCDVRIIAASSRNIPRMIRESKFREDLYYRIAILEIQTTPLRTRPSDIPVLIKQRLLHEQQLAGNSVPFQIDQLALSALTAYEWPGNIRQLQNIVSRLAIKADGRARITEADVFSILSHEPIEEGSLVLPADVRFILPNEDLSAYMARVQSLAIDAAMQSEVNRTLAAERLGYTRTSLLSLKRKLQARRHRLGSQNKKDPTVAPSEQQQLPIPPLTSN